MPQLTVQKYGQAIAIAGMLVDNGEDVDVVSRFNTGSASIPFGVAVAQNSAKRSACQTVASSADVLEGINLWGGQHVTGSGGDLDTVGLKQNAGCQILRNGRAWVVLDGSVTSITPGDRAYVRTSTNGSYTTLGVFSNAAGTGLTDLTKVCQFAGPVFTAADGVTKVAECDVDFVNKP